MVYATTHVSNVLCCHRQLRKLAVLLSCCLLTVVLGCSSEAYPGPPPVIHLPGVAPVAGVTSLEKKVGGTDTIQFLAVAPAADGSRQTRIFFTLDNNAFYTTSLDGGTFHQIPTGCPEPHVITADGHWALCQDYSTLWLLDLTTEREQQITLGNDLLDEGIAWGPGDHYFATVSLATGTCSIAIYRLAPTQMSAELALLLAFPQFTGSGPAGPECSVGTVDWSPNGKWLSFVDYGGPTTYGDLYILSLASILALAGYTAIPTAASPTIQVPSSLLVNVGSTLPETAPAWNGTSDEMTYVSFTNQRSIMSVNVVTLLTRTVLVAPSGGAAVLDLCWSPDGQQLMFLFGRHFLPEIAPTPAQLYVYTPPLPS